MPKVIRLSIVVAALCAVNLFAQNVERWEIFEKTYTNDVSYNNPFHEVALNATFTHTESGTSVPIIGFYDGDGNGSDGNLWKIRFAPTLPGEWSFTAAFDDANAPALEGGTITCVAPTNPNNHGFCKADPDYPHHVIMDDGHHPYIMGNTAYHLLISGQKIAFLDKYISHNFNYTRFVLNSGHASARWKWGAAEPRESATKPEYLNCSDPPGDYMWFFRGTPENGNYDMYDLRVCASADEALSHMRNHGMLAEFMTTMPEKCGGHIRKETMTVSQWKNTYKYQVARWGAFRNVWWCFSNESNEISTMDWNWVGDIMMYVQSIDPYDHFVGFHEDNNPNAEGNYNPCQACELDWTDFSCLQHRPGELGGIGVINSFMNEWSDYDKILVNAEFNYEGEFPYMTAEVSTQFHWGVAMANSYGVYGDKTEGSKVSPYFDAYLGTSANAHTYLRHLPRFFTTFNWWECEPRNEIIASGDGFAMKKDGVYYVVFSLGGNAMTLNLATMNDGQSLPYHWYEPYGGTWTLNAGTVQKGNSVTVTPPEQKDYVLLVSDVDSAVFDTSRVPVVNPSRRNLVRGHSALSARLMPDRSVAFELPGSVAPSAMLYLYDLRGRRLAALPVEMSEGRAMCIWDGRSMHAAEGTYVARLVSPKGSTATRFTMY